MPNHSNPAALLAALFLALPGPLWGAGGPPSPRPGHPGNIFLHDEIASVPVPPGVPAACTRWRLLDEQGTVLRTGHLLPPALRHRIPIGLGMPGIGWFRLEFGNQAEPNQAWTSLAVLRRLRTAVPADTPVAADSAPAWFARDDIEGQRDLANLAALAGLGWIRDRLRWSELQPLPGPLVAGSTTYDSSAETSREAGLRVLQDFHEVPEWGRTSRRSDGIFDSDLRSVYEFSRLATQRFRGLVDAWEAGNEANARNYGRHPIDQICAWQKAAWLGSKAGNPEVGVGWIPLGGVPTPQQTHGILANETWPYFDTFHIHTYDWPHAYEKLWEPVRDAASGRPIWVTEADRASQHKKNAPWYDLAPEAERLKAEFMAQSYASSLFAGSDKHFHFILGNYQEHNENQFGLLRHDLTPRPSYVALAAIGRCLAGARVLGRLPLDGHAHAYAFRTRADGRDREVLVAWAEKEGEWADKGRTTAQWQLPEGAQVEEVIDYLGRSRGKKLPEVLAGSPVFVFLPLGTAEQWPLEAPPAGAPWREGTPSPVVLQLQVARPHLKHLEDLPWASSFAHQAKVGEPMELSVEVYNFGPEEAAGELEISSLPDSWELRLPKRDFTVKQYGRFSVRGSLLVPAGARAKDGWVILHARCGPAARPALAFRVVAGK